MGVGHICRLGTRALGVDEGEQLHIAHLLHQLKGLLEVLFGLAGEAHDDITGEGDAGDLLTGHTSMSSR